MYKISCNLDVSNTVVDDGSWSDHYGSKGNADDAYGKVMLFENANISGRSSSMEEDTDTEKISVSAIFPVEDKNAAGTLSAIEEDDETSVLSSFKTIEIIS